MSDEIGQRGEALFVSLILKSVGRGKILFRPQFLGDKWPNVDFLVELIGAGATIPYFFVQVKTTRIRTGSNLKIQVKLEKLKRLAAYPAPVYLVGIDEVTEEGYIISAKKRWQKALASLPTKFPINQGNQKLLWQEVKDFWRMQRAPQTKSRFRI